MKNIDRIVFYTMLMMIIISLFWLRNKIDWLSEDIQIIQEKEVVLECK